MTLKKETQITGQIRHFSPGSPVSLNDREFGHLPFTTLCDVDILWSYLGLRSEVIENLSLHTSFCRTSGLTGESLPSFLERMTVRYLMKQIFLPLKECNVPSIVRMITRWSSKMMTSWWTRNERTTRDLSYSTV